MTASICLIVYVGESIEQGRKLARREVDRRGIVGVCAGSAIYFVMRKSTAESVHRISKLRKRDLLLVLLFVAVYFRILFILFEMIGANSTTRGIGSNCITVAFFIKEKVNKALPDSTWCLNVVYSLLCFHREPDIHCNYVFSLCSDIPAYL